MESRNPVFSRMPEFKDRGYAGFGRGPQQAGPAGTATTDAGTVDQLEQQYSAPSATPTDTGRMTYDDVIMKTATIFGVLLLTALPTWFIAPGLWLPAMFVGLVLGLVNAFKKEPSPGLILLYAAAQGVFLGGISRFFETAYDGIVMQAVLATVTTFGAMLFLYKSGRIRVTPKFQRIMFIAVLGYAAFCVVNLVAVFVFQADSFRQGPFGLLIGAVGATLAALVLVLDFDFIDKGVKNGIPARYAWTAAFGLAVTLIWLYIEFLRIIAILRGE